MVVGTPGGSRIITAVLHTIINVIDYGMNVQEAVDAPRFHQQWLPEATNMENFGVSPDTRKILEGMGHKLGSRSRRITSPRSWSARHRWGASRWPTTASTARTIRAATPGWRSVTDAASNMKLASDRAGCLRRGIGSVI